MTASFTRSNVIPTVTVETGRDTEIGFGTASGRAIEPPEIEYPVAWFYVTVHAPFPVILNDVELDGETLTLGLENPAVDDDYAELPVKLAFPFAGHVETQIEKRQGQTVEVQVFVFGDDPVSYTPARYERSHLA